MMAGAASGNAPMAMPALMSERRPTPAMILLSMTSPGWIEGAGLCLRRPILVVLDQSYNKSPPIVELSYRDPSQRLTA
jgi:hypothetical protein